MRAEYIALECRSASELTQLVNEMIGYGWLPIGGVSVSITQNKCYGNAYCQALQRAGKESK